MDGRGWIEGVDRGGGGGWRVVEGMDREGE